MIIGTSCEKMAGCRSFAYIVSVWSRDSRWARTFSINALGLLWNVSTCTCVDTGVQGADELICTLHDFAPLFDSVIVLCASTCNVRINFESDLERLHYL